MKLIGGIMEERLRDELIISNQGLLDLFEGSLNSILTAEEISRDNSFVLNWIPDQSEELYEILISEDEVLIVEIPFGDGDASARRQDLKSYLSKKSNLQRMRVAVALDIVARRRL